MADKDYAEDEFARITDLDNGPPIQQVEASARAPAIDTTLILDDPTKSETPKVARLGLVRGYIRLYRDTEWWIMVAALCTAIAAGIPLPIISYIIGDIVDQFGNNLNAVQDRVWKLILIAFAFFVLSWAYMALFAHIGMKNGVRLREQYVRSLLHAEVTKVEGRGAEVSSKLGGSIHLIQSATGDKAGLLLQSISYFVTAFVVAFIRNAILTAILSPIVPVFICIVTIGSRYTEKYTKRINTTTLLSTNFAQEAFRNIRLLKSLNAQGALSDKFGETTAAAVKDSIKKAACGALMTGAIYFVIYLTNALAFWEGSRLIVSQGQAGAGSTYVVVSLVIDSSFVIGMVSPFLQIFGSAAATGDEILAEIEEAQGTHASEETGVALSDDFAGEISFKDVSFAYPSAPETVVLNDFNLTLEAGKFIGIVGQSGSCKSTVINLIERFYAVQNGKVCLDGRDFLEYKRSSWRQKVSLVSQEPILFSGTIFENIASGLLKSGLKYEEHDLDRLVKDAARQAHVSGFVESLEDGYDTEVGSSGGSKLSVGQRQRITLARAIISQPRVLLLDEATSAVDTLSEKYIAEALRRPSDIPRTTVVVAHRLTTIKDADLIIVMHQGEVIEQGSHAELVEKGGKYAEMVEMQSSNHKTSDSDTDTDEVETASLTSADVVRTKSPREADTTNEVDIHGDTISSKSLVSKITQQCRPEKIWIVAGLCSAFITGCITAADALLFGYLISTMNQTSRPDYLLSRTAFLSVFFILVAGAALFGYGLMGSAFGVSSIRLTQRIKNQTFRHLVDSPILFHDDENNSADRVSSRIDTDAAALGGLSGQFIGSAVSVVVSILSGVILAHIVGPLIAVVLLPAVPVIILSGYLRLKVIAKNQRRNEAAFESSASLASEAINNIKVVASFCLEDDIFSKYHKMLKSTHSDTGRYMAGSTALLALAYTLPLIIYALAYLWGSYLLSIGRYTSRDYFIVLPALLFSAQTSGQLFAMAPDFSRATIAAKGIFQMLSLPKEDCESQSTKLARSVEPRGKIEFRNVSFKYPTRDEYILRDLSFIIPAGKKIAFIGRSGCGKTTIFALLSRFYEPTSGRILIDDVDISEYNRQDLRRRVTYVPQESSVFSGSVRFNLQLADPTADDAAMAKACEEAQIWDYISSLPDGLGTILGLEDTASSATTTTAISASGAVTKARSGGVSLSGGQRQRLSLARAFLSSRTSSRIMLLDEPTAALDAHNEALINKALDNLSRTGRTMIQIAHRLGGIMDSDLILVFEAGRVLESGTHQELLSRGNLYAELVACMM